MSFQSYLENIKAKTAKSAEDFRKLAAEKGFTDGDKIKDGIKAGDIVEVYVPAQSPAHQRFQDAVCVNREVDGIRSSTMPTHRLHTGARRIPRSPIGRKAKLMSVAPPARSIR